MKHHKKKILDEFFQAKLDGLKPFEIRVNDCDYQVGDIVDYNEIEKVPFSVVNPTYRNTGRTLRCEIIYITDWGQPDGQIVYADRIIGK